MSAHDDRALDTLFLPFAHGDLTWSAEGGALFLRARDGWPLRSSPRPGLVCVQDFRPDHDALARAGLTVRGADEVDGPWPLVLVLPPRQRDEARALFAHALDRLAPGGVLVACMENDDGAKSGEADLRRLAGLDGGFSKHHCRVFWTRGGARDAALMAEWRAADAPRIAVAGRFHSRPGVFAWDRIDAASALLAAHLPDDLCGHAADLGAGWGYLADALLARCPGITALDLFEADARALALARLNLAPHADRVPIGFHWHDVTRGLPGTYDVIVSNPPFHTTQRAARPEIGQAFIRAAADALRRRGRLWLVANRHLPYEQVLGAHFGQVRTVAQANGFKVVEAVKA